MQFIIHGDQNAVVIYIFKMSARNNALPKSTLTSSFLPLSETTLEVLSHACLWKTWSNPLWLLLPGATRQKGHLQVWYGESLPTRSPDQASSGFWLSPKSKQRWKLNIFNQLRTFKQLEQCNKRQERGFAILFQKPTVSTDTCSRLGWVSWEVDSGVLFTVIIFLER